jgi:hypothetical protein
MAKHASLDNIVNNGFDFFRKSLAEFDAEPKFSVIHFFAAVELFLKARLMAEHWSLVVSKDPNWDNFERGDFKSVTLDECLDRLAKIAQSPVSTDDAHRFKKLAKHRNKIVHFHHELDGANATQARQAVAAELCSAWRSLFVLLTQSWAAVFKPHLEALRQLDQQMRKYREYLQAIYDGQREALQQKITQGQQILPCPSCGFDADHIDEIVPGLNEHSCSVCNYQTTTLDTTCPACGQDVSIDDCGFATCPHCDHAIEPQALASHIWNRQISEKDDWESGYPAHCADCDGYQTVVPFSETIVCASCFMTSNETEIQQCDWCSDMNAGDMEDSSWAGCVMCEGSAGHHRDKDD